MGSLCGGCGGWKDSGGDGGCDTNEIQLKIPKIKIINNLKTFKRNRIYTKYAHLKDIKHMNEENLILK